jgi:hypothetical protein
VAARARFSRAALAVIGAALAACASFKSVDTADAGHGSADDGGDDGGSGSGSGGGAEASDDGPLATNDGGGHDATAHDGSPTADTGGQDTAAPPCDGSSCPIETVVSGLHQATLVRVDASNVYFGDEGTVTGNVYQCPKAGCATPVVLGPGFATGLGVDGVNVYWNDFSGGQVVSCAIGGCQNAPTTIAPTQLQAEGVTFDGTNLFWATGGSIVTCVPPACSTRTPIVTGLTGVVVQVASETGVAYWVSGGSLESCAATGCGGTPAKPSSASGQTVFVKNGVAYFTSGNAVVSCPVTGCTTPHTIGASDDPYGIGTDGVDVYWLDDLDEVVFRCPVSGCNAGPEHFAEGQLSQPGANVALDGEYAYWTVPEQVLRKHK